MLVKNPLKLFPNLEKGYIKRSICTLKYIPDKKKNKFIFALHKLL